MLAKFSRGRYNPYFSKFFFLISKSFNPQNWNGKTAGWQHDIQCNEPVLDHCLAAEVNETLFVHLQFMHKSNSVNRFSSQFTFWTPSPHLQIVSVFWNRVRKRTILLIAHSVSLTIFLKISGQLCFTSEFPGLRSGHDHVVLRIEQLRRNSRKSLTIFPFSRVDLECSLKSLLWRSWTTQPQLLLIPETLQVC